MLVVVAILGILTTLTALSLNAQAEGEARRAVERLALVLEAAQLESQAGQRQLAWSWRGREYQFWQATTSVDANALSLANWQPVLEDPLFQRTNLAEGLEIAQVLVEGQPLPIGALLILRRGDPTLFQVLIVSQGRRWRLRGLPNGQIEWNAEPVTSSATTATTSTTLRPEAHHA